MWPGEELHGDIKVNYLRRERKSPAEETFTLNLPCVTRKAQPLKEPCAATSGISHQRERENKEQSFPSAALIKQLIRSKLRWMCCCSLRVWGPSPGQNKGKGANFGSVGMKLETWFYLARFSPVLKDFTSFTGGMNLSYSNPSPCSRLAFQTLSSLRDFCLLCFNPPAFGRLWSPQDRL